DAEGKYSFEKSHAGCDKVYRVRAEKEHYTVEEKFIKTGEKSGEVQVDLALKKIAELPEVGKALNDLLDIPVLYFDFNKWEIRPDAEDRKSTRLNSSHVKRSYAVLCKKN